MNSYFAAEVSERLFKRSSFCPQTALLLLEVRST